MNNKTKETKIGNENFKTWLKKLDPVSRIKKMSAIAKTQASAGLRGSLIKASLAQLSQRCQVMLIKLTEEEIKFYTRRTHGKSLTGLEIVNISQEKILNNKTKLAYWSNTTFGSISSENVSNKHVTEYTGHELNEKKSDISKLHTPKHNDNFKSSMPISKESSSKFPNAGDKNKLKRKFQELFGDDFDDAVVDKSGSNRLIANYENNSTNKVNNFLSATVNVNIYNSPIRSNSEKDSTVVQRQSHVENSVLNVDESSNKRLRIDVSLSNDKSDFSNAKALIYDGCVLGDGKASEKSHKDKTEKRSAHNNSKHLHEKSKTKHKKGHSKTSNMALPSNINTNNVDEDPSIKELWSILGMESPTDRSESIIKSYPPLTAREITSNTTQLESETKLCDAITQPSMIIKQTINNGTTHSAISSEKDQSSKNISTDFDNHRNAALNESFVQEGQQHVFQIEKTFSLVDASPNVRNLFEIDAPSSTPKQISVDCQDVTLPTSSKNSNIVQSNFKNIDDSCVIEIDDDDDDLDKVVNINNSTEQNLEKNCKVGTIRVKNLGLLLNTEPPTDIPTTSDSVVPTVRETCSMGNNEMQSHHSNRSAQNTNITDRSNMEECFLNTYKYYFDECVELKIPKLGELLHLAVADRIRRNERIKRAEQLSSYDLIKEEKQRADKDFSDMMKLRGIEFSPLCELILKNFDKLSKTTLFIALFCRILKHAEKIDPANKNYILEAKYVIHFMLIKHQFKDKEVSEFLQSDLEEFKEQVNFVSHLTDKAISCGINPLGKHAQNDMQISSANNSPNIITKRLPVSNSPNNSSQVDNVSSNTTSKTNFVPILPKKMAPTNCGQTLGTPNSNLQNKYSAQDGKRQVFGDQTSIPLKENISAVNSAESANTIMNSNSLNRSNCLSKTNTFQKSANSVGIAFVSMSQPFTVQSFGGTFTSSSQKADQGSCASLLQQSLLSLQSLSHLAPTTIVSKSNVTNPSLSLNLLPQSISTSTSERPIVITSVPSQSTLNTISNVSGQSGNVNGGDIRPAEVTHVVVNRLASELSSVNMLKKSNRPIIIREVASPPAILGLTPNTVHIQQPNSESSHSQLRVVNTASRQSDLVLSLTSARTTQMASTTVTNSKGNQPMITTAVIAPARLAPSGSSSSNQLSLLPVQRNQPMVTAPVKAPTRLATTGSSSSNQLSMLPVHRNQPVVTAPVKAPARLVPAGSSSSNQLSLPVQRNQPMVKAPTRLATAGSSSNQLSILPVHRNQPVVTAPVKAPARLAPAGSSSLLPVQRHQPMVTAPVKAPTRLAPAGSSSSNQLSMLPGHRNQPVVTAPVKAPARLAPAGSSSSNQLSLLPVQHNQPMVTTPMKAPTRLAPVGSSSSNQLSMLPVHHNQPVVTAPVKAPARLAPTGSSSSNQLSMIPLQGNHPVVTAPAIARARLVPTGSSSSNQLSMIPVQRYQPVVTAPVKSTRLAPAGSSSSNQLSMLLVQGNQPVVTTPVIAPARLAPAGSSSSNQLSLSPVQGQVPSSSHCHPFVKRMPISGKMRMLFGSNNSRN